MSDIPQEQFTLADRRELIKQGMQLEELRQDVIDLKVLINEKFNRDEVAAREYKIRMEDRVRRLEDTILEYKTFITIAGVLGGGLGTMATLIVEWFAKSKG